MTTAVPNDAAHEPLQALIDELWRTECQHVEAQETSLSALEEAMRVLQEWGDRLEQQETEQTAALEELEAAQRTELEAAEEVRCKLEHDLHAARARIADVEAALQARTEELLHAQAANNALAAELQAVTDSMPAPAPAGDPAPDGGVQPKPSAGSSVSERFSRLRQKRADEQAAG